MRVLMSFILLALSIISSGKVSATTTNESILVCIDPITSKVGNVRFSSFDHGITKGYVYNPIPRQTKEEYLNSIIDRVADQYPLLAIALGAERDTIPEKDEEMVIKSSNFGKSSKKSLNRICNNKDQNPVMKIVSKYNHKTNKLTADKKIYDQMNTQEKAGISLNTILARIFKAYRYYGEIDFNTGEYIGYKLSSDVILNLSALLFADRTPLQDDFLDELLDKLEQQIFARGIRTAKASHAKLLSKAKSYENYKELIREERVYELPYGESYIIKETTIDEAIPYQIQVLKLQGDTVDIGAIGLITGTVGMLPGGVITALLPAILNAGPGAGIAFVAGATILSIEFLIKKKYERLYKFSMQSYNCFKDETECNGERLKKSYDKFKKVVTDQSIREYATRVVEMMRANEFELHDKSIVRKKRIRFFVSQKKMRGLVIESYNN